MLSELLIENFAIVDTLLLRFDAGFTVLTGETGAGKSIIVDALQTALGARVAPDMVRSESRFAAVEAVFDLTGEQSAPLAELLAEQAIVDDGTLILRREIGASGRGSARINGRAVSAATLAAVGDYLVDIHGQSDHLSILRRETQLEVLDQFGELLPLRARASAAIRDYTRLRQARNDLAGSRRAAEQRLDLLQFQVREIEAAKLQPDEEAALEASRNRLANAERLAGLAGAAYDSLAAGSGAAIDQMQAGLAALRELVHIDHTLASAEERLTNTVYEVEDIGHDLREYRDQIEIDPARLDEVEERLGLLHRLKRKYGATIPEVIAFGEQAQTELEDVEMIEDRLADLEREVAEALLQAGGLADELSEARQSAASAMTDAMHIALQGLGLKGTEFSVKLTREEDDRGLPLPHSETRYAFTAHGIDNVSFLVSFNPGEPLRPLEKVASGGETSRFLLALRSVLSLADQTPTLVFDEVDVGIGGKAGTAVGERLHELARRHQVLSITHLPQVAALADHHLAVIKSLSNGRTSVDVRALEAGDRVNEIAEMMSGTGTAAARKNAEELLAAARREHTTA